MSDNAKYWAERKKKLESQLENEERALMKKLSKDYDKALAKLEKEIGSYYSKYGKDNVIEYRKLLEQLSEEDKKLLYEKIDMFAFKHPEYSHLMPTRESIYKLNRLEGLQQEVHIRQCELGIISEKQLQEHLKKMAEKGYKTAGGRNLFNNEAFRKLINRKWVNGENFSDRIWKNADKLGKHIVKDFQNAIIRGDSYTKCTKELRRRFNVSKKDAHRLVYTEGTYIMNESSMTAFEESYEEYKYSAILDSRTSPICAGLNGKIFKIKDRQPGVNFPPMHPRCRSSYEIVFNEKENLDKVVADRLNEIKNIEGKITSDMKHIVKSSNGYLEGLNSKIKTEESLKRKVLSDSKLKNISIKKALSEIHDILRYTTIFKKKSFVEDYFHMNKMLKAKGYDIIKVKNTWSKDSVYKGVNTILEKDGEKFEMQYHTKESFELKNGKLHELYEEVRLETTSAKRKDELHKEMVKLSGKLKTPRGIEAIK